MRFKKKLNEGFMSYIIEIGKVEGNSVMRLC